MQAQTILTAQAFEFVRYQLQPKSRRLDLHYRMHFSGGRRTDFVEKVYFPSVPVTKRVPKESLEQALVAVHLMLGVSYYKLYAPRKVIVHAALTAAQAEFWTTVYRKGLGEFFYRNKQDPRGSPVFQATTKKTGTPAARE